MSKTSTDPVRHALSGPTMGTRWSALFHAPLTVDEALLNGALQAAVDEVDTLMSTWKADSALMCLNRAPVGVWNEIPARLAHVLSLGVEVGRASDGAFDIGMGDAVQAWGFGPDPADPACIRQAMTASRRPTHEVLRVEPNRALKTTPVTLDLNGIAKGYGVDRLAEVLLDRGIDAALVGIDGEMRALCLRPDGEPWTIAIEAPDPERRAPYTILALQDAAVATSGDYRHWVDVQGRRLSHTMDPRRGAPLLRPPALVTVVSRTCAEADAWATALMVAGAEAGVRLAARHGLDALFLFRNDDGGVRSQAVGQLFSNGIVSTAPEVRG